MSETQSGCLVCNRTHQDIPLITLEYQEEKFYICPEHLPVLIHHPEQLTGRLPGAEKLSGHQH